MPEAYRPGLPVLSDEERARRNALQQEWSNPFKNETLDQRPSMASLYEDEPSTDELLAAAKAHLAESAPMDRMIKGAGEIARRGISSGPQSTEMHAPEPEYGYGDIARDVVVGASIPASFVPGPIGMIAGGIQGINALATGDAVGAGFAAIPAMRALRALRGAKGAASMGPIPKTGAEIGAKVSYPRAQATSMQVAGDLPASTSMPRHQLRDVPVEGPQPYVPNDDDRWLAQQIAALKQRIGLADTAAPPSGAGPKVRAFSEGEEAGIEKLGQHIDAVYGPDAVLGPGGRYMSPDSAGMNRVIQGAFGDNPMPSASRATARQAVEMSDADRAMLREGGTMFKGKSGDDKLNKWAMSEEEALPSPAEEYLIHDMPATDWNKTMFGGGTSSTEGTFGEFVRPKNRTPIGKRNKPARRGEGDEAITWNPR